jgi:5-methylcytosine-specific restriction endonuclease McrA
MGAFRTRNIRLFDGLAGTEKSYVVCTCGYVVWQMDWDRYSPVRDIMERNRRTWNRKQSLFKAGGMHTQAELRQIADLQRGRCIYCNRLFTDKLRLSKDHLLPVCSGGSDWALNIVLACRNCNSKRCNIPFRTYCTLLSPTQNKRIFMNLVRRLEALDFNAITPDAYACFEVALASHEPRHPRYRDMKGRANRNVKTKTLLPRGALPILRRYNRMLKCRIADFNHRKSYAFGMHPRNCH